MNEASQYTDIPTPDGNVLRVIYEMTVGDMLVCAFVGLLLFFLILNALMKKLWR